MSAAVEAGIEGIPLGFFFGFWLNADFETMKPLFENQF
jgi:hypothetical protein